MLFQYFILLLTIYRTTTQEKENTTLKLNNVILETTNVSLMPTNVIPERTDITKEEESIKMIRNLTKEVSISAENVPEDIDHGLSEAKNVSIDNVGVMPPNMTLEDATGNNGTLATNETVTTPAPKVIVPCRNDTEWTCYDLGCIAKDSVCDGLIDCEDASDEYRERCNYDIATKLPRPMFGLILHCSSFWTEFHSKICPKICLDEPEFCYYALSAENGVPDTCKFPSYPEHGSYSVKPYSEDWLEQPRFHLAFNCVETYVLVEEARLECVNGSWRNENVTRYCSEACPVKRRDNFTYSCPKFSSASDQCGKYVAIGTTVAVGRILPKQEGDVATEQVSVYIQCMKNKEFNITKGCVQEIDDLQNNFEKPTMDMMTYYETSFNRIKSNDTTYSSNFETLVKEFHAFEGEVKANLTVMDRKADQCDILLDLMLLDLEEKQAEAAKTSKPSNTTVTIL